MKAILLALAFVAPVLSGCVSLSGELTPVSAGSVADITASLSQRLGDLPIVHEVIDIETSNGLVNVDLYLPTMPDGAQVPLILVASPYNNGNSPLGGSKTGPENWIDLKLYNWIRAELIPRGYAFAQMDILGTRNSGGCMGIMNEAERQATADTIDALAQMPWSDGKVGMTGKSYLGLSQIGAAVQNPEHLRTIVPISAPTQDYAYHYYNGVPYALNHATNSLYYGAYSLPAPDGDPAQYGPRYAERFPCAPEGLAASASGMGDYNARWQERDYRPLVPEMRDDISVFFIHGHQDWNVKPDHILDIFNAIPGPKLGLIGQWAHDYPNINNANEERWGEREDWYFTLHRWFDHWLKGIDTGLMQEVAACPVETQGSDAVWRCAQAFPPLAEAGDMVGDLVLHPSGATLSAEAGTGTATYADAMATPPAGVSNFVTFTSETFTDATRIVGVPELTMKVSTTSTFNTFLAAALGVEKDGKVTEFTWGFQSLRHREGLEAGKTVTPGTSYEVTFGFYPVDHVFAPGESLVLVLRGTSPGPNGGILANPTPGVQIVDLGATSLRLPTLPIEREFTPRASAELPDAYPPE